MRSPRPSRSEHCASGQVSRHDAFSVPLIGSFTSRHRSLGGIVKSLRAPRGLRETVRETVKQVFHPSDDALVLDCRDKLAQALAEFGVNGSWPWFMSCHV